MPGPVPGIPTFTDPLGKNLIPILLAALIGALLVVEAPVFLPRGTAPIFAAAVIPVTVVAALIAIAAYGVHKSKIQRVPTV
jgi:hypothetical protein